MKNLTRRINDLTTKMENLFNVEKIDEVKESITTINDRMEKIESELCNVNESLSKTNLKVETMVSLQKANQENFLDLDERMQSIENKFRYIERKVTVEAKSTLVLNFDLFKGISHTNSEFSIQWADSDTPHDIKPENDLVTHIVNYRDKILSLVNEKDSSVVFFIRVGEK